MNGERRNGGRIRLPLHVVAATGSTLLLVVVAGILAWSVYSNTRDVLSSAVDDDISHISRSLQGRVQTILQLAENQLGWLTHDDIGRATTLRQRLDAATMARMLLEANPILDAWYVGYPNGEFVLFRPLRSAAVRALVHAPPDAVMLVQTQTLKGDGSRQGDFYFSDDAGHLTRQPPASPYVFDPRTRPWYQAALDQPGAVVSKPYVFFTTRQMGVSLSRRVADGVAVVGMDAALQTLATELSAFRITPGTRTALIDDRQQVLATDRHVMPGATRQGNSWRLASLLAAGEPILDQAAGLVPRGTQRRAVTIGGKEWELISVPFELMARGGTLRVLLAIPHEELFAGARKLLREHLLLTLGLILASIPMGFWLIQQIVRPLRALVDETRAVAAFDFNARIHRGSRIKEVDMLATATTQMKRTISRFIEMNGALNSEKRLDPLLRLVLTDVARNVGARSGALYLFDEETSTLDLSQYYGREEHRDHYPQVINVIADVHHPVGVVARTRESMAAAIDEHGQELMVAPLETLGRELVGVIALELSRRAAPGNGRPDPLLAFVEALSSSAAVAIETRHLLESQKVLLEGMIHLVAGAIDAKSPYTGGHCQRVPEIARLLVQAASDAKEGPFAGFALSEDDWEAVHIAAWLHDCGKMTTPEYVVDKATKLETLYNRIHEIRMRFEVLKRNAEVACWKAVAEGTPRAEAEARMQAMWQKLDEDFAFVASCNVGGESMDPARIARLREIGSLSWLRTLDDRLGLSREECHRLQDVPAAPLPARETVLADRPEHRVVRPQHELIPANNPWGFKMRVPELKFNLGELYNLSVVRGTLTDEERYLINEHIVQTIIMLHQLPFPRHLRSVPEIAGGHHERMDGTGYPKGLTREEMSIPARIMAVADVFEALTAGDRPYKTAKTLSESLRLMADMVYRQHLDGDVFELFLRAGVYRAYAQAYLAPAQIDEVDLDALLAHARHGANGVVTAADRQELAATCVTMK